MEDIGNLIAGISTIKDGRTLREAKPGVYEPKTQFGKLIDNAVSSAIKNAKLNYHISLMERLAAHPELVAIAREEIEKEFIEKFGEESLVSTQRIDKIFGKNVIAKLSYLAKTNGVPKEDVDNLIQQVVSKVLRENNKNED
jgi:GTPase Era involved in 16S rRNA processing